MPDLTSSIRERYLHTLDNIAAAARSAGRAPSQIRLVVVTKSQPVQVVESALAAGVKILGENYPAEGVMKIQSLRGAASAVEWHMIGHIQSRRSNLVAEHFNLVHSLDTLKIAERLDRFAAAFARRLPVLLEFNLGGEETKFGWPARDEAEWEHFLPRISSILALPNLEARGLMTMPPLGENAEAARPFFQKLHCLQAFLRDRFPQADWTELSMGTSADYEVAVQEGATLVRVGTAIVGPRQAH
jgi:pyridoxal phosphate enzyme (YggS family)